MFKKMLYIALFVIFGWVLLATFTLVDMTTNGVAEPVFLSVVGFSMVVIFGSIITRLVKKRGVKWLGKSPRQDVQVSKTEEMLLWVPVFLIITFLVIIELMVLLHG